MCVAQNMLKGLTEHLLPAVHHVAQKQIDNCTSQKVAPMSLATTMN